MILEKEALNKWNKYGVEIQEIFQFQLAITKLIGMRKLWK